MMDLYVRLAKHLDKLSVAFPYTDSGLEIEILRSWFSPREAEIALQMKGFPEPVSIIAGRLEMPPEALGSILEEMSKKGLIFRMTQGDTRETQEPIWLYNLIPMAEGLWEFHLNSISPNEVTKLNTYVEFFMDNAWYKTETTQHRVVPISKSVSATMEIMTYDQAENIVKSQKKIAVAHCICRKQDGMLGKGCDHPSEVCMAFGTGAYYYIENGLGREILPEEALTILHKGMEAGLVLQPGNGKRIWGLCMCCSCGCQLIRSLKKIEKPAQMAHSNFYAACNPDSCSACGLCVDRCPMGAIELLDTAEINKDRCIGCGVCVVACDFNAIVLQQQSELNRYVPPKDFIKMHQKIAKERGLF